MSRRSWGASLLGAAAMITAITVLSRVLGFVRWMVQAQTVGYGAVGTAYTSANTLPNVLFEVTAGGALAGALIPLLAIPLARDVKADVDRIASAMLTWALVVLVPVAVVCVLVAEPLARFFLRGPETADPDQVALAALFLRVFAVQVPLYGVGVVLIGVLQAHRRFFWPAFAPIMSTAVVLAAYVVFAAASGGVPERAGDVPSDAVAWLAWGTTAGVAALSLPLVLPVLRLGVRLRPRLGFPPGVARRATRLAAAGTGALLAQQVAVLVTMWLSNRRGGVGAWPVFQYTQAVYLLPYAVLAVPLATSAFPRLAERVAQGDTRGFARLASGSLRAVVLLGGLGAAVLAACAPAISTMFRDIGVGDGTVMDAMAPALTFLAPGLVGFGALFLLSRSLYALERSRVAVVANATAWVTVVVASVVATLVLVPAGGDAGRTVVALGLGSSLGMLVGALVAGVAMRRVAGPDALAGTGRTVLVTVGGAVVAATVGRVVGEGFMRWWTHWLGTAAEPGLGTAVLGIGAAAVVALGVYGLAVWLTDRPTVRALAAVATSPGGKR